MVERIMLLKLHDPTQREELATATLEALSKLPEIEELSVGLPADASSEKSWDLSIVIGVANLALLTTVLESAQFRVYLEHTLKDRVAVLKAWSFERVS